MEESKLLWSIILVVTAGVLGYFRGRADGKEAEDKVSLKAFIETMESLREAQKEAGISEKKQSEVNQILKRKLREQVEAEMALEK